jgi:hypothetical protein
MNGGRARIGPQKHGVRSRRLKRAMRLQGVGLGSNKRQRSDDAGSRKASCSHRVTAPGRQDTRDTQ